MKGPKWIADVLELTELCRIDVDARSLDEIATAVAEAFPVEESLRVAVESLTTQLHAEGLVMPPAHTIRAIAANVVQAIAGVVCEPNTEATEYMREWVDLSQLVGNIGAPALADDGRRLRLDERLSKLIDVARAENRQAKIARLRAAHAAFWRAYHDGDIEDFHPDADDPDKPNATIECGQDEYCTCAGRAALNELQHAIDDIAGPLSPGEIS